MIKFSIVIPIFNEAKNIVKLSNLIRRELNKKFIYEIIFVDDNSQDGSKIILKEQSKKNKKYKIYN
jgi:glycosyltransferase involved in cell wall biosynthesis